MKFKRLLVLMITSVLTFTSVFQNGIYVKADNENTQVEDGDISTVAVSENDILDVIDDDISEKTVDDELGIEISEENFEDSHIRVYLRGFDKDINGYLDEDELKEITSLSTYSVGTVNSFKGIEHLKWLELISFSGLTVKNIDVSHNKQLKYLCLYNSDFESIDISENNNLIKAYISGPNLKEFIVGKNDGVQEIIIKGSHIGSLDVTKATNLRLLSINDTGISNIDLSNNRWLHYLDISDNDIESINLRNNTNLRTLKLGKNKLTNIDLSQCLMLEHIEIYENQLEELDVPGKNLTYLDVHDNKIKKLDLSSQIILSNLNCSNNEINELYVEDLNYLEILNCANNNIEKLDIRACEALKYLQCEYNNLSEIDISNTLVTFEYTDYNPSQVLPQNNDKSINVKSVQWQKDSFASSHEIRDYKISFDVVPDYYVALNETNFPDPVLRKALKSYKFDLNGDGYLSRKELADIVSLSSSHFSYNDYKQLKDLKGIEKLKYLKYVTFDYLDHKVDNFDFTKNKYIISINCESCNIDEIDTTGLLLLVSLECTNNNIKTLDFSTNTKFQYLLAKRNPIEKINLCNTYLISSLISDEGIVFKVDNEDRDIFIEASVPECLASRNNALNEKIFSDCMYAFHTHEMVLDNVCNRTYHWEKCKTCGYISGADTHGFDAAKECTVCSYKKDTNPKEAIVLDTGDPYVPVNPTPVPDTDPEENHIHKAILVERLEPECESDGYKEYYTCECKKNFEDNACDLEITDIEAWKKGRGRLFATGHKWDAGQVVKESTYTDEGVYRYTCETCKKTRDEAIAKLGVILKDKLELAVGNKADLNVLVQSVLTGTDKAGLSIDKFVVSNKKCVSINKDGVISAKKAGTATVTAFHKAENGDYSSIYSFSLIIKKAILPKKYVVNFLDEEYDLSASLANVPDNQLVTWSLDPKNTGKAVLNEKTGKLTVTSKGKIKVNCVIGDDKNASSLKMSVTVKPASIGFKDGGKLPAGKSKTLLMKNITPNTKVDWSVSDSNILKIDEDNGTGKIKITGVSKGTAELTAEVNGHKYTVKVNVK